MFSVLLWCLKSLRFHDRKGVVFASTALFVGAITSLFSYDFPHLSICSSQCVFPAPDLPAWGKLWSSLPPTGICSSPVLCHSTCSSPAGDSRALTKAWEKCSFKRSQRLAFFYAAQSFFASQAVEEVFEVQGFCLFVHFKVSKYSFSNCVVLGEGYWLIKNQHWSLNFF